MNLIRSLTRFVRRYPFVALTLVVGVVVLILSRPAGEVAAWVGGIYVVVFVLYTGVGMVRDIIKGHWGLDILAVVAMISTLAVGEYLASLVVVLMLSGGEALEDAAAHRARRDLDSLLAHAPAEAHRLDRDRGEEVVRDVELESVAAGDLLLVRPGEVVPVDGRLEGGAGEFDLSSLTGESMPQARGDGDEVLSGSVNGAESVRLRVLRPGSESQFQQIVALVAQAQQRKAPVVRLADRFAVPFTVGSLVIGIVAWIVSGDPLRFAQVMVLATPCPLLIAAPVAFLGGLSRASRAGMVVKDGGVLEQFSRVRTAAFDKTGTLTRGRPELVAVLPAGGLEEAEVLTLAASAEQHSGHVLASGITAAATDRGLHLRPVSAAEEHATHGVEARVGVHDVAVGKPSFVASLAPDLVRAELGAGQAAAYVSVDGRFAGTLVLADAVREEAPSVLRWLRAHGVRHSVILSGDVAATADAVGSQVGVDEVRAELLPADKVDLVGDLTPAPVLMVGDGVNDAPVLAAAGVGVAMGAGGATAAGEAADAVILRDSLEPLAQAVAIGRHTVAVALTSIWIGIGLSVGLMLVATTGVIPAVVGALVQEGVDLACILYALLALRSPEVELS